jgi:hypothetical protein
MFVFQTAAALMTAVVLAGAPRSVSAQGATTAPSNVPAQKTIGVTSTPEAAKADPALIVMNAAGAILADSPRNASPSNTRGESPVREYRPQGSVPGARGNPCPYRDSA